MDERTTRFNIATRNSSDRLVDLALESSNNVDKDQALTAAGFLFSQDKKQQHSNIMGALLERAKNLQDCKERDQLMMIIGKNLGLLDENKYKAFTDRTLQSLVHKNSNEKTKNLCMKLLLNQFKRSK